MGVISGDSSLGLEPEKRVGFRLHGGDEAIRTCGLVLRLPDDVHHYVDSRPRRPASGATAGVEPRQQPRERPELLLLTAIGETLDLFPTRKNGL